MSSARTSRWLLVCLTCGLALCCFCDQRLSAQGTPKRPKTATKDKDPGGVNRRESVHFVLLTDLSVEESQDLLQRLETMLGLIEKYFDRKLRKRIPLIVAKDLSTWPANVLADLDPEGIAKIQEGAGVTLGITKYNALTGVVSDADCMVYAVADRGTPQHEAVHAYCLMSFGRTGPTWYSEGMAEIGQYWKEKELGVHCHEVVLEYLQRETPKKTLTEVVDTTDRTGDSWQNYAWRWVLCHLLANNPNYSPRFKPLGLGLLAGQRVSFESVYGPMAREISFEYDFFLNHIAEGYRCDLCAWDWKAKYVTLKTAAPVASKLDAQRGWQPSKAQVSAGQTYEYSAVGLWKISADAEEVTADGDPDGKGKLWGVIFDDYRLSEPFELGSYGTFTPPSDGQLLLRCGDEWGELADNSGKMAVKIKLEGKGSPLPREESVPKPATSVKKKTSTKSPGK